MSPAWRSQTASNRKTLRSVLLRPLPAVLRLLSGGRRHGGGKQRILLVRPDHIGDILLTTPALRVLRSHFPDASITYLVGPWSKRVIEGNPNVDEILTHDFSWFNRRQPRSPLEPYLGLLGLTRSLRDSSFDTAISLRSDFWFGALLINALGIPRRIGYDVRECRPFLSETVSYTGRLHEVEKNLRLVRAACNLGEEQAWRTVSHSLDFYVSSEEREFAEGFLRSHGVGDGDVLVAIHPCSGWPTKRWTARGFASVGDELSRQLGAKILLTGTSAELNEVLGVVEKMRGKAIVAAGETTLGQLAAVLERCALVVGVDSGVLHLAVAMQTPSVHIFGPSDHEAFGPCGPPDRHVVVRAPMNCAPCGEMFSCTYGGHPPRCMLGVRVEDVLTAACRVVKR